MTRVNFKFALDEHVTEFWNILDTGNNGRFNASWRNAPPTAPPTKVWFNPVGNHFEQS
jgi:hypothetical protein